MKLQLSKMCIQSKTTEPASLVLPSDLDEKYIVLIFENGLAMKEQMILEDILTEIGKNNNLSNFPAKLPFEEANCRLVNYNKTSKQKEEKVRNAAASAVSQIGGCIL